jgi:uncharacterized surface protein with fasciclin (FAS1) repeats
MRNKSISYILNSLRATIVLYVLVALGVSSTAFAGGHKAAQPAADIVDTAISAGSFTTLVAAIQAAGLVDALKDDGPYTVFAPTDEAFAQFASYWPGTLENLLKPENQASLQRLLTYHVVPGKVMAADISGTMKPNTLEGLPVTIVKSSGVTVNYATVIKADIETSNGVIHVIDAVLIPAPDK